MRIFVFFIVIIIVFLCIFIDNDLHHKQINAQKDEKIEQLKTIIQTKDSTIVYQIRENENLKRKVNFLNNYIAGEKNLSPESYN